MNRLLAALACLAILAAFLAACGGDDDTAAPARETLSAEDQTGVTTAVDAVAAALQARSIDDLRALYPADERERLDDEQLSRQASCLPENAEMEIKTFEVESTRDGARARITFGLTPESGSPFEAVRDWRFLRQDDGTWLLANRPDCPF